MPVDLAPPDPAHLYPISGLRIGVVEAGIRKAGRKDLTLFLLDAGASVGAVFTSNRFCAAPVQICQSHLASGAAIRALLINTGNANAGTGADGLARARSTCDALAQRLGIEAAQVLPFSTGVIMEPLPAERIIAGLDAAISAAKEDNWLAAAQGIMTTDTVPKAFGTQITIAGKTISVTGISKGAGMIRPNMATMLGYIATDACVAPALLQPLAKALAQASFNRITVDGDTSTNDSLVLVATNKAAHAPISALESPEGQALYQGLLKVALQLAQAIVRDGEGATKFITVHADLDTDGIELYLDDVHVATRGGRNPAYQEADGQRVMKQSEILVRVGLGRGQASHTVWTCDLSHEYVSINADYRS